MANNGTQTRMQHGVKAQFRNNKNKNTPEFDHAIQWRKKKQIKNYIPRIMWRTFSRILKLKKKKLLEKK